MKTGICSMALLAALLLYAGAAFSAEWYVSPEGSSTSEGSISRPWDMHTALWRKPKVVQPGDTIWEREPVRA